VSKNKQCGSCCTQPNIIRWGMCITWVARTPSSLEGVTMESMSSDFYEDDEPAAVIHHIFDSAPEKGRTESPLPFGACLLAPAQTVGGNSGTSRRVDPGMSLKMTICAGDPAPV